VTVKISFPAIHYSPKFGRKPDYPVVMKVILSEDSLGRCNKRALKKRVFDSGAIYDSKGQKFKINGIDGWSCPSPLWKWPKEWFESELIKANLLLSKEKDLTLTDFAKSICGFIDQEADLWKSGIGVSRIKKEVNDSKSFKEIIEKIYGDQL
jgi:L-fucose isomerase-like protein